jgi:hypothetical protein
MQRIQDPTAVATIPAVPPLSGVTGFFTGGNPSGGIPATIVRAWFLNLMMQELVGIVEAAGIMPSTADRQVVDAIRVLMPTDSAVFQTPGTHTWICPGHVTRVLRRMWSGGGGGAGGTSGQGQPGGGGNAYYEDWIGVVPGTSYPVVVGAGGAGGLAGQNGGNGTSSSFGGASVPGGQGGVVNAAIGGAPGTAMSGSGLGGGGAYGGQANGLFGGQGGAGSMGGSGGSPSTGGGQIGAFPGGGGSGGGGTGSGFQGGGGANGAVSLTY